MVVPIGDQHNKCTVGTRQQDGNLHKMLIKDEEEKDRGGEKKPNGSANKRRFYLCSFVFYFIFPVTKLCRL